MRSGCTSGVGGAGLGLGLATRKKRSASATCLKRIDAASSQACLKGIDAASSQACFARPLHPSPVRPSRLKRAAVPSGPSAGTGGGAGDDHTPGLSLTRPDDANAVVSPMSKNKFGHVPTTPPPMSLHDAMMPVGPEPKVTKLAYTIDPAPSVVTVNSVTMPGVASVMPCSRHSVE